MIGFLRFSTFARVTAWFTCFTVLLLVTGCGGGGGSKSSGDASSGSTFTTPTTNGNSDAATASAAQGRLTWLSTASQSPDTSTGTPLYQVAVVEDVNVQRTFYYMTRLDDGSVGQLRLIRTEPIYTAGGQYRIGDLKSLELDESGRPAKAYCEDPTKGYAIFNWVSQQEVVMQFFDQFKKEIARSSITANYSGTPTTNALSVDDPLPTRMAASPRSQSRGRGIISDFKKFASDVSTLATFVKQTIAPALGVGATLGVGTFAALGLLGLAAGPALIIGSIAALAIGGTLAANNIAEKLVSDPAAADNAANGLPVGTYTPPTYTPPSSGGDGSSTGGSGGGSTNGGQVSGPCGGPNYPPCHATGAR